ncbi:hypothetical protein [Parafilimonas sp.]|uniref:hypothetical protein n=1 Tax=Parafilimonas sp. TaxID=1969739 RepID=UPI003F80AAF2
MKDNIHAKVASILSAMFLLAATLYSNSSNANVNDGGGTEVHCPDGNTYVCATMTDSGGHQITAYKGSGSTTVVVN